MDLAQLQLRQAALARHDGRCVVFGATMHGWRSQPVAAEVLETFEAVHGVQLPAQYRTWLATVGVGAGPFYGLMPPTEDLEDARPGRPFPHTATYDGGDLPLGADAVDGTVRLSDQGCGYCDLLVLNGPHAGEVWVDFREAEGPITPWYPDFAHWLAAWLVRSEAEWAVEALGDGEVEAEPAFLATARAAVEAVVADGGDPMLAQYPIGADKLHRVRAQLFLQDGVLEAAEAAFEQAAACSSEPGAVRALGQCAVARARGDEAARLAAAQAGLATPGVWWSSKKQLLSEQALALEGLARWDEAFDARVALARHDARNLHARYDVAWICLLREDAPMAAAWLVEAAQAGVGCEGLPEGERLAAVAAGLLDALRGSGHEDRADLLEAALGSVV